jgi:hypothetical protein
MSWGPPTWYLLHGIIYSISEQQYSHIRTSLWEQVKSICSTLPCPDCSSHAITYLSRIPSPPPTRDLYIKCMFQFHNIVNQNIGKPFFGNEGLDKYKIPLPILFYNYKKAMLSQPYNPNLMIHKMKTSKCVKQLETWLRKLSQS